MGISKNIKLDKLSEAELHYQERLLKYQRDYKNTIDFAFDEGKIAGIKEGIEEAIKEWKLEGKIEGMIEGKMEVAKLGFYRYNYINNRINKRRN